MGGFVLQALGLAGLFLLVEGIEVAHRRLRPGRANLVYWGVKLALGLPIAAGGAGAIVALGLEFDGSAVLAGLCLGAAGALWLYGWTGTGPGRQEGER